jgi:hypothetical protein
MEYLKIFKELQTREVRYLLCGGMALNIYGIPRMTADIDILVAFETENMFRFEKAIAKLNYKNRFPVDIMKFVDASEREKAVMEKNLSHIHTIVLKSNSWV